MRLCLQSLLTVMRALSDLPEITLDSDEYGIAWSFDTLPETITQFNQEVSSMHAGNSTLHKKAGADYQDPTGMVLSLIHI